MTEKIWKERKRIMGLPISFTKYSLTEDRIFTDTGLFNSVEDQLQLYMVKDIALKRSFGQKLLGLGTIELLTGDRTSPVLQIKNIPNAREVKEKIYELVLKAKDKRRVMYHENFEDGGGSGEGLFDIEAD